jgi:hypothetical protein
MIADLLTVLKHQKPTFSVLSAKSDFLIEDLRKLFNNVEIVIDHWILILEKGFYLLFVGKNEMGKFRQDDQRHSFFAVG